MTVEDCSFRSKQNITNRIDTYEGESYRWSALQLQLVEEQDEEVSELTKLQHLLQGLTPILVETTSWATLSATPSETSTATASGSGSAASSATSSATPSGNSTATASSSGSAASSATSSATPSRTSTATASGSGSAAFSAKSFYPASPPITTEVPWASHMLKCTEPVDYRGLNTHRPT